MHLSWLYTRVSNTQTAHAHDTIEQNRIIIMLDLCAKFTNRSIIFYPIRTIDLAVG
jgi:hypothetical protein